MSGKANSEKCKLTIACVILNQASSKLKLLINSCVTITIEIKKKQLVWFIVFLVIIITKHKNEKDN